MNLQILFDLGKPTCHLLQFFIQVLCAANVFSSYIRMADSCDFGKLLNTPSDKLLYARQTGRKNIKVLDANLQYILLRRAKLLEQKDNVFAICFHHEQFSGKVFENKADKCCIILTKDPNRYKKVTFLKKKKN